ncbi:MAG: mechanosensitive ion channel family protein [Bacteroidales bacterium]
MNTTHPRRAALCLFWALLVASSVAFGQSLPLSKAAAPSATEPPGDPLGRATPLGTVQGFLAAGRSGNDALASRYLHTNLSGAPAAELAHRLFVVLDRRMPARLNQISNSPEGSISDSLLLNQDLVGSITTARGTVNVLVERVEQGRGGRVWLFSSETLAAVPELYDEVSGATQAERWIPSVLLTTRILGISLFGWLLALVGVPFIYLLTALPVRWLSRLASRWRPGFLKHIPAGAESAQRPVRLLLLALVIASANSMLTLSLRTRQFWADAATTITIAAAVWLLVIVTGKAEQYLRWRLASRDFVGGASVLRLARWAADVVIVAVGLFVILHYFGVNPTAAIAGLGVGGIAVALAAQKTLENVIAGISLILDQAVRVGDTLKLAEFQGTVDDVGLRSTRIRTLDRTIVSVPNGLVATMSLETLSARDKFWFHPLVRLRCETTVAQIGVIVDGIRRLLAEHSAVERDSVRVRFLGFGPASLDVDVFAYVVARDWNEFLEIQEGLLFRAMELVEQAGAQIAIPSQIMYHAKAAEVASAGAGPGNAGLPGGLQP